MKHFLMRTLLLTGAFLFGYYYSFGQIVISEFSYDPPESGTDSLEFVEIVNIGNQPVDISGYKLWFGSTIADRFTYPANTILAPNQVSVIAVNPGALLRNYGMTTLAHQWTGTSGLGNSGSKIVIRNANNVTVDSISYTNSSAPSGTNGNGKTAVLCDLTLDNNVMSNWTASTNEILRNGLPHTINGKALYGSPGFLECGLTTEPADQWNDECTSATVLSIGTQCTATEGNLLDATESMGGCTGWGDANDLWYSFVATTNNLLISVTTEEDVVLEIFEGSCGDLTSIECVDYDIVNEVYSSSDFILGETYFVRVYAYNFEDLITGDFTICVQEIVAPENDECVDAIVLSVGDNCTPTTGNLHGATESLEGCAGWNDANDVWYSFVATTNAHIINVSTEIDVVLEVFNGTCGTMESLACIDEGNYGESYNSSAFVVGQTYYVRIYGYFPDELGSGEFAICVLGLETPSNDECVDAIALTVGDNCTPIVGNLLGATESLEGCAGYNVANDVWYSFVATSSILEIRVETQEDVVLQVFEGTCGSLDDMVCVDDNFENENYASTDFVVGQTYFVRVYAYDYSDLGVGDFTICVQEFTTVINNDCSTATTLISSTTCTPVSGTLINSTVSDIEDECNNYENHDVWYSFVAQSANTTIIVESLDLMDPIISVYTGACGSLTQVSCEDDEGGEIEELELSNLTVGSTYFIRVTDYNGGSEGSTEFSICVTHEASVDPCADVTITGTVTGCGPEATVVADGGTSPHTFEWSNGETTDSVTNLMVGETYTITITDNNGCTGQTTYVPVDCPIADPCVNVVVTGVVSGCDGELDVVPAGGIDPYTYLWSNGATTQGALIPSGEEEYFVTITDANGCTGTVEFEWLPCAAISNVDGFHSLMVYPNPTSNQVTIEIATLTSEQLTIELINAMGQVVMSTEVFNNGQQAHNLSLVDMSTGMYVISIKGKEFVKTERLNVIK